MLDETLKDYFLNISFYRRQTPEMKTKMRAGQLLLLAVNHRNAKVRQRLAAFLAKETQAA